MQIVSAREFRSNQGKLLAAAKEGQFVILNSRLGAFRLTPISPEERIAEGIREGLEEVKLIEEGKLKARSLNDFLDEL